MNSASQNRPPPPPFRLETARQKVRFVEDGWNSHDPGKVSLAYKINSQWRIRSEFETGCKQIVEFLTQKWALEQEYRLINELWTFKDNRIVVRFAYQSHNVSGQ